MDLQVVSYVEEIFFLQILQRQIREERSQFFKIAQKSLKKFNPQSPDFAFECLKFFKMSASLSRFGRLWHPFFCLLDCVRLNLCGALDRI